VVDWQAFLKTVYTESERSGSVLLGGCLEKRVDKKADLLSV
jgi:hypothetical protein